MKQLRKIIGFLVLLVCAIGTTPVLAESVPRIYLNETGADYEYRVSIQNWDSLATSVQFDIIADVGKPNAGMGMVWADPSCYSHTEVEGLEDGRIKMTFYVDKKSPLSNSATATIGNLSFHKPKKAPSFSTSGYMKLLRADNLQEGTTYENVKLEFAKYQPSSNNTGSGNGSGSGGGSGGSSGGSRRSSGSIFRSSGSASEALNTWKNVSKNVETKDGVSVIELDMRQDGRLSADILKNLAKKKIQAVLDYGSYQWQIDGGTIGAIPSNQNYYDLSLNTRKLKNLSVAANDSDLLQFETAYDGDLPFTAQLRYQAGKSYAGKILFLGYYNEQDGLLEYVDHQKADSNGYVTFSFMHFSRYVITSEDLWGILQEEIPEDIDIDGDPAASNNTVPNPILLSSGNTGGAVIVPPANDTEAEEDLGWEDGPEYDDPEDSDSEEALSPGQAESEKNIPASSKPASQKIGLVVLTIIGILLAAGMVAVVVAMLARKNHMK